MGTVLFGLSFSGLTLPALRWGQSFCGRVTGLSSRGQCRSGNGFIGASQDGDSPFRAVFSGLSFASQPRTARGRRCFFGGVTDRLKPRRKFTEAGDPFEIPRDGEAELNSLDLA